MVEMCFASVGIARRAFENGFNFRDTLLQRGARGHGRSRKNFRRQLADGLVLRLAETIGDVRRNQRDLESLRLNGLKQSQAPGASAREQRQCGGADISRKFRQRGEDVGGHGVVFVSSQGGQGGFAECGRLVAIGQGEQGFHGLRFAHFAERADVEKTLFQFCFGVLHLRQGFVQRRRIALAQTQDERRVASGGQRSEKFIRQSGHGAPSIRFLETFHELRSLIGRRRGAEQLGANEQILATPFQGEAPHQSRQNVFPDQRVLPDGRRLKECEHGIALPGEMSFEHPPAEQRHARIAGIGGVGEERVHERKRLRDGKAAGGGRHLRTHAHIGFSPGLFLNCGGEARGKFLAVTEQTDGPFANRR